MTPEEEKSNLEKLLQLCGDETIDFPIIGGSIKVAIEALKAQSEHPDTNVEETTFKPGDKFILELGKEYLDGFEIKGADLCMKIELLKMLTPYEPELK